MSREILFRGKREDNGEWVYGDLRQYKNMGGKCKDFYTIDTMSTEFGLGTNYNVIEGTVGQFTGLTDDKNGKKIFEGDIVDCWSEGKNARGTVQQRKDGLWIIYPSWQKNIMWGLCPDINGGTTVEVIGNRWDNPELLGE